MKALELNQVIQGKRYSTQTATLLCGDDWWDGHNRERSGTQCFLYRTPKGAYFFQRRSQWQGAADGYLEPCTEGEAQEFFESCERHDSCCLSFDEAFPSVAVEDA